MLLWVDGFDSYGASATSIEALMPSGKYVEASGSTVNAAALSRHGYGQSVQLYYADIRKAFVAQTEIVAGVAYYHGIDVDYDPVFIIESDNLLGTRTQKCKVAINGTGGITVTLGTLSTILYSDPNLVFPANWHYFEVKYKPSLDSTGVVQVRVDNALVITYTGITCAGAETVNLVALPHNSGDSLSGWGINYGYYDDFYVLNTDGSAPLNDFLGDVICYTARVASDDGVNQFDKTGGTTGQYTAVNAAAPDADTSYLSTDVDGEREIFGLATLPASIIDVLAVSITVRARKDAAGVCGYKIVAQHSVNELLSSAKVLTGNYLNQDYIMETKPGGGGWTPTNVQALKIGIEAVI